MSLGSSVEFGVRQPSCRFFILGQSSTAILGCASSAGFLRSQQRRAQPSKRSGGPSPSSFRLQRKKRKHRNLSPRIRKGKQRSSAKILSTTKPFGINMYASVDSKGFTWTLNHLESTFTKKRGRGMAK